MASFNRGFISLMALFSTAGISDAQEFVWTARNSGTKQSLNDIVWIGNSLVAVGDSGKFLTSGNGADWTLQEFHISYPLKNLLWTGSRLVSTFQTSFARPQARGWDYTDNRLASTDGKAWTTESPNTTGMVVNSYATCGGLFLSLGHYLDGSWVQISMSQIRVSSDGTNWESRYVSAKDTGTVTSAACNGSGYVALESKGFGLTGDQRVLTSSNGQTWTRKVLPGYPRLNAVAWRGGQYVAVGAEGAVARSTDGSNWVLANTGVSKNLRSITATSTGFVAVGDSGIILKSTDGNVWTSQASGTGEALLKVLWTGSGLVAIGGNGTILTYGAAPVSISSTARPGGSFGIHQAGSRLNVEVPASLRGPLRAAVYAVGGQKLQEVNVLASEGRFSTDVGLLAPGIYTLEVKGQGQKSAQSFKISR